MRAFTLDHVPDDRLLSDLAALVATDRRTTAALLAHLAEVQERKLYLPAACSSMFVYATRVLGFSEDAALKRIRAARVARRFPVIFEAIADGRVHLSGVVLLAPHFREGNVEEILAAATHRTRAELEELVARLAPKPDLPTSITRIDPAGPAGPTGDAGQLAPGPPPAPAGATGRLALEPPAAPERSAKRTKALAPGRYALEVTIGQETQDKLVRAQALLRHRNPGGELAEVLDCALDALLMKLEKERFGAAERPRVAKARGEDADPRYVPREVRREVHARDGEQCTFVSDGGVRCTERAFLELDHRTAVARGGQPTVDGTRILCHAHNQYEAERQLGADFMRDKREKARARRTRSAHVDTPEPVRTAANQAAWVATRMPTSSVENAAARVETCEPAPTVAARPMPTIADVPMTTTARLPMNTVAGDHVGAEDTAPTGGAELAGTSRNLGSGRTSAPTTSAPIELDREVTLAMRGMGFGAGETSRAIAESAGATAATFEARLRAALAAWRTARGSRCSDGPFDEAARHLAAVLGCAAAPEMAFGT